MADKRDEWADSFSAEPQGWLSGLVAEEKGPDRRLMWRLGSWGLVAVSAVAIAVVANQSQLQLRRDQFAAGDALARQAQQLQQLTREAQAENRRFSQAIDTLNGDRDRLFTRVGSIEQGLESVTGSIKRQAATPAPALPTTMLATLPVPAETPPARAEVLASLPSIPAAAAIAPAASMPAAEASVRSEPAPPATAPIVAAAEITKPTPPPERVPAPEPEPAKPAEIAPVQVAAIAAMPAESVITPVSRTEFGVDLGGANSIDGLRALWRGIARSAALEGLRPIIMVKERSGPGPQLRLVAGPVTDAAAAAQICASLAAARRACETSVFDGQKLALRSEAAPAQPSSALPKPARPALPRRAAPKPDPVPAAKPEQRSEQTPRAVEEAQAQAPAPKPAPSLSNLLGFSRE